MNVPAIITLICLGLATTAAAQGTTSGKASPRLVNELLRREIDRG